MRILIEDSVFHFDEDRRLRLQYLLELRKRQLLRSGNIRLSEDYDLDLKERLHLGMKNDKIYCALYDEHQKYVIGALVAKRELGGIVESPAYQFLRRIERDYSAA